MTAVPRPARAEDAAVSYTHFYCPMVPGGGGDWLQQNGELVNPYFGSEMLRCGERVQALPPPKAAPATGTKAQSPSSHQHGETAAPKPEGR